MDRTGPVKDNWVPSGNAILYPGLPDRCFDDIKDPLADKWKRNTSSEEKNLKVIEYWNERKKKEVSSDLGTQSNYHRKFKSHIYFGDHNFGE